MILFRKLLVLLVLHLISCSVFCQTKQKQLFFEDPRAGSFTIFGDIPVSHATGVPDISIPLFTLESHGYKIPITLKYHLSLVKPPYDYTNVATGWVLDAGGTITQEINCLNDFNGRQPSTFLTGLNAYTQNPAEKDYLNMVAIKNWDFEHDIFNYTFADKSGKFIVDKNSTTAGKFDIKALTAASHLKGSVNTINYPAVPSYDFQNMEITDDQGYNYLFQDYENGKYGGMYSKSYFLNSIKTPNGIPLFTYEYGTFSGTGAGTNTVLQNLQVTDEKQYIISTMNSNDDGSFPLDGYSSFSLSPNSLFFYDASKTVKKITFENGTLEFTLSSNNRYIDGMVLKDKNNQVIKAVTFDIQNFPGQGFRYLNKVFVKDRNLDNAETYELNYNGSYTSMTKNDFCLDYWGYQCYGSQNQYGMIPMAAFSYDAIKNLHTWLYQLDYYGHPDHQYLTGFNPYPISETKVFGEGTRNPNFTQASIYTLNSIKYPTGGKTEFTYGLNQSGTTSADAGGLRIEKVKNYTADNTVAWQKRYEYTPGEIDFPLQANYEPTTYNFDVYMLAGYRIIKSRTRSYMYNKTPPVSDNRVRYSHITEYWENESGTDNIGKTVYDYIYPNLNLFDQEYNNWYIVEQKDHISGGLLDTKTVYKKNGPGYSKLSEEKSTYGISEMWRSKNLFLNRWNFYSSNFSSLALGWDLMDAYGPSVFDAPGFNAVYYDNVSAALQLTHKTTTSYTDNGLITTDQDYEYADGLDKFITGESITTSDQGTKKTTYKYAYSPEFANQFPYSQMIAKNIISDPIEIKTQSIKGGITKLLSTVKLNYNQFGQDIFRPANVQEAFGNASLETRFIYTYDEQFGNLINTKKNGDLDVSYIYDDTKSQFIAQVNNSVQTDIAFTSFESDAKGNWSFTGAPIPDATAITGKKLYNVVSGQLTKSVSNAGVYIVSYWSRNGQYNVNNTTAITGRSINNWIYYEHKVTLSSNGTVVVSGSGVIDELRLYPEKALMTSITYEPLIGMSSQCDVNNRITYYQYDAFNRLKLIRDQDNNIIKKICYNYAGQPENCLGVVYINSPQSGTFIRNNCPQGYTGSTVTYTVPAGTYSSTIGQPEADQLAINDVNANGQNYANTNGTCTAGTTYYNTFLFQYFTRNDCPPGYTGSSVQYTVAANTYSSTISQPAAQALAQNDIDANGQNYANANGTCTLAGCAWENCHGLNEANNCINGQCEMGIWVYIDTYYDSQMGQWVCVYHYEYSDGSWTAAFYSYGNSPCYGE